MIQSRLSSMKVLIVLDDIDHGDHLEYLAGDVGWFGNGSRVVVTTRNKQLIENNDAIYELHTLPDDEAMQLFNQHAFKKEVPDECFKKFSLEVVYYAKGLPLALKVWGSMLHKKGVDKWKKIVDKIKNKSNSKIIEKLKISYDGLEPEEQIIFLDIACFFRGDNREEVMQIVESYDSGAEYILDALIDKSLVFISEYGGIEMHDLIEDMGKYIVKMQKDSGKPSRVWNVEDFEDVMMDNMGTMTVEAIWLKFCEKPCFSKESIKNMQRLRILSIWYYGSTSQRDSEDCSIEYLPNNLCCFVWHSYPWKLLPENFNPRRLVHLELQWSSLHYLWNETKQFLSLRRIDLSYSNSLKRTPDFKGMPNLEYLNLMDCRSLEEVHHSLEYCKKLIQLNLYHCKSLERFPYVNVESLESLDLDVCYSLEKFPEILGIIKPELKITMSRTGIRELPLSFFDLQPHLTELHLNGMENLVSLPSSICKSKGLVRIDVSFCVKLESLPEEIGDLENLEKLDASYTLISRPPSSIVRLNNLKFLTFANRVRRVYFFFPQVDEGLRSLEYLDLTCCYIIDGGLPEDIGSLSSLKELKLSGNNFEHLPRSIAQLGALEYLKLSYCKRLTQLPEDIGSLSSLKELKLGGNNFEHLPRSIAQLGALEYLELSDCKRLTQLPEDIGSLSSLKELKLGGNNFELLPQSIAQLGALQTLDLSRCMRLTQLPEFPQQLHTIAADWSNDSICNSLFQNISSLQHDICTSDSLSLRVFTTEGDNIPRWFHHREDGTSIFVKLPKNWYVSENFLGFAVCFSGQFIDGIAHLFCYHGRPVTCIAQKLALSIHSEYHVFPAIHCFLVPLTGLLDKLKANGKTPNDYGCIKLTFSEEVKKCGLRLLYKHHDSVTRICRIL
ncbi:hypothetical protein AABB24_037890 [Solanum stoloniferum]